MSATVPTRKRRVMTPTEKQGMEQIVQEEKGDKTETADFYPTEKAILGDSDQVKRLKKELRDGDPGTLNKYEKVQLEERAKKLKAWLQKNMCSQKQVTLRASKDGVQSLDFRKSVSQMARLEMSAEFQEVAKEYKNIMRMLGRPEEANLEEIRPD